MNATKTHIYTVHTDAFLYDDFEADSLDAAIEEAFSGEGLGKIVGEVSLHEKFERYVVGFDWGPVFDSAALELEEICDTATYKKTDEYGEKWHAIAKRESWTKTTTRALSKMAERMATNSTCVDKTDPKCKGQD